MTNQAIKSPRKLIEVALPLDAINHAAALEKQPFTRKHPRSLHIWWARRPFVATRAIIFAQLVNDPGYQQGNGFKYGRNKKEAALERKRLFKIIEDLAKWENTTNDAVLESARAEIRRSWREVCELNKDHPEAAELFNPKQLPALHDPFAGGGAIPVEAQRLGLEAFASDLNPVAVLINKAMIEIPPIFASRPPVSLLRQNGGAKGELGLSRTWVGAAGLAEDILFYGTWMREEAQKRIGHLYPAIEITPEMAKLRADLKQFVGQKLTTIAWIWARTVKSPNPAFSHVHVPLISTFILSSKDGKEAYVQPIIEDGQYKFVVKIGRPPPEANGGTKAPGRGAVFRCLISGAVISGDYIKSEGQAGRMGTRMMAVIAEGVRARVYLDATQEMESLSQSAIPTWAPPGDVPARLTGGTCVPYGLRTWGDLFTSRQLVALTTFSDLVDEVRERIRQDILGTSFNEQNPEGEASNNYADAVSVYLALAVSRWADLNNSLCTWNNVNANVRALFSKQSVPMSWDFVELSAFSPIAGFDSLLDSYGSLAVSLPADVRGFATQSDAQTQTLSSKKVVSTDPPYYDNIAYADLSDFFYVWLRRMLRDVLPTLFATISVPKDEELVATAYRHGGKAAAEKFFLNGMTLAMTRIAEQAHPEPPVTIYYAFKQSDTDTTSGTSSTGWETFLEAVIRSGFQLTGTWPMKTERAVRTVGLGTNALASSIILVCRQRSKDAPTISRREFIRELNTVLPEALDEMTKGSGEERSPVAPVDLSQAIIGPGMAVFSKYTAVLEATGSAMSVRTALQLINRFLAEDDFDHETQFCLHWFEQHGWVDGAFGEADVLSRAKATSVTALTDAGIVFGAGGKVRLLKWVDYSEDWNPRAGSRISIWKALHQLIRALRTDGESASGILLAAFSGKAEAVRQLAYRLYTLCERLGQAEDARAYNELITSWSGIESAAASAPKPANQDLPGFER